MTARKKFLKTADVKTFSFNWTIENYEPYGMDDKKITSNSFTISGLESTKWKLVLHPNGKADKNEGHISLFLHCLSDVDDFQFPAKFSLTIRSTNDKKDYTGNFTEIHTFSKRRRSWGFHKFIKNKYLEKRASDLLPNRTLTLICTGDLMLDVDCKKTADVCGLGLLEDTKCMLESQVGRDVTLVARDGTELPVHKVILCAQSPVFAAMFDQDTEEKKTGRVVIKDFNSDVLRGLISFMYTDEAPEDVTELAMDLLISSHKYQIPRLQFLLVKHVSTTLIVENVLSILSHAVLLDLPTLKDGCLQFIKSNVKGVTESQSWKEFADVDALKVLFEYGRK